ncbi:MAG: ABC transporter ATP-binding protein/permease, partial [Oscillospiraceae bacterium]|nr:ABC transporter ATP-binding protein/permease [Oscillospiraceae bacterium]
MKKLKKMASTLVFLLSLYKKYALGFLIVTVVFWAFWGPANSLLNVYTSSVILDQIVKQSPYAAILLTAAGFAAAQFLLTAATQLMEQLYMRVKQTHISFKINREIFDKAIATDYKYYDSPEFFADFTWAAQNLDGQLEQARSILENLIQNFTQFIAMTAYILMVGPWVLLVSAANLILSAALQFRINKLWVKQSEENLQYQRRQQYFHRMFYTVEPAADMKATRIRNFFFRKYDKVTEDGVGVVKKYGWKITFNSLLQNAVSRAAFFANVALIVYSVIGGEIANVARYSALLAASQQLQNAMINLTWQFANLDRVVQYMEKVRKFFDIKSEIEISDGAGGKEPDGGAGGIEMRGVKFAYGLEVRDDSRFVLNGLDMQIKPGEKIAIVGENGVGKSTLMKLLLRLYDVSGGEIRVNGVPLADYDVRKLRDRIGVAFQNSTVYALPLAENLRVYRDADEEQLRGILKRVGLSKLLDNEGGIDAELTREFDDNGVMLSGGEMQKFALARLLTGGFGLLLLDEPTASLDPLAEYELNKMILDRNRPETIIVIAHRLSTVRDADRIYLIDNGAVAEAGSHE